MKGTSLGEFEEIVLLSVAILGEQAYGVSIREEISQRLKRNPSIGALHAALNRLEEKGFLESKESESTPERGGRRKLYFLITKSGIRALKIAGAAQQHVECHPFGICSIQGIMTPTNPPRIPTWLIEQYGSGREVSNLLGDLYELHQHRVGKYGKTRANFFYWIDAMSVFTNRAISYKNESTTIHSMGLLTNYIKVAGRNLLRQKTHTAINMMGLSIGLAFSLLIYLSWPTNYGTILSMRMLTVSTIYP